MASRPVNVNRDDLAKFIKDPRTIRAFENLAENQDVSADTITQITGASIVGVTTSDVFTEDRFLNGSSDILLTDGGPKGPLTLGLTPTGAGPATYGSPAHAIQIAVDGKGRLTLAAQYQLVTDNVAEGSNLYFTTDRARQSLSAGTGLSYDNVTGVMSVNSDYLTSGSYTPTLTIIANASAVTARVCHYARIGTIVMVWGALQVTPTASGAYTDISVTLPIPSNLAISDDAWGVAGGNAVSGMSGTVAARPSDDTVQVSFVAPVTVSAFMTFSFAYRVIT